MKTDAQSLAELATKIDGFSAATIDGLCEQFQRFCDRHRLPQLSADELLCELYGEEPRREELCEQVRQFIDIWDAVCDAEFEAFQNRRVE